MNYYKRLSPEELNQLEKEFIDFLVLNGIVGSDWEKLKNESADKAEEMIMQFSEVIYETSLRKAKFLLMVDKKVIRSFQCLDAKIIMTALKYNEEADFNFHNVDDLQDLLASGKYTFEIAAIEKEYSKKREHEMYDMILAGCKLTSGEVFKLLSLYYAELKSSQN